MSIKLIAILILTCSILFGCNSRTIKPDERTHSGIRVLNTFIVVPEQYEFKSVIYNYGIPAGTYLPVDINDHYILYMSNSKKIVRANSETYGGLAIFDRGDSNCMRLLWMQFGTGTTPTPIKGNFKYSFKYIDKHTNIVKEFDKEHHAKLLECNR